MNFVSGITNPYQKFVRQATNFSGQYLTIYPWPVASNLTRIKVISPGALPPTVIAGNTLGAQPNVYNYPETLGLTLGEWNNNMGAYILDPTNAGQLQLNFNQQIASGSTVIVEGYAADTKYNVLDDYTLSVYGNLEPRIPATSFARYFLGNATNATNSGNLTAPIIWKNNSITGSPTIVLNSGQYLYIGSNTQFRGIQINLASEDYTTSEQWTLRYWNGSWSSVGGTVVDSLSNVNDNSNVIFNQSGTIIFTYAGVSGWVPIQLPGDPYVVNLASINTKLSTGSGIGNTYATLGMSYPGYQYWVQLGPPSPNNFTVNIGSISVFSY